MRRLLLWDIGKFSSDKKREKNLTFYSFSCIIKYHFIFYIYFMDQQTANMAANATSPMQPQTQTVPTTVNPSQAFVQETPVENGVANAVDDTVENTVENIVDTTSSTMFGGNDASINYDENSSFEAVDGSAPQETYDFQDFTTPFNTEETSDTTVDNTVDNMVVEDHSDDVADIVTDDSFEDELDSEVSSDFDDIEDEDEPSDEGGISESVNEEYASSNQNHEILEKFSQVYGMTKKILDISEDHTSFAFSGGETVNSKIEYQIYLIEDEENHVDLFFKKIDTHIDSGEEDEHLIQWTYYKDEDKLDIFVDEVILYQIGGWHSEEEKRENMIIEKLNKFQNFFEGYYDDLSKEVQKKKEIEEQNRLLHEIFKNF